MIMKIRDLLPLFEQQEIYRVLGLSPYLKNAQVRNAIYKIEKEYNLSRSKVDRIIQNISLDGQNRLRVHKPIGTHLGEIIIINFAITIYIPIRIEMIGITTNRF